jgi:hypothetical protein
MTASWAGPLGAVSPLLAPSWLIAVPLTTANTGCPEARASEWRQALGLDEDKHLDTFDVFGNLFGAGAPVTLDHAVRAGRLNDGDLVVLAGFAHAGDFAAASALRWRA